MNQISEQVDRWVEEEGLYGAGLVVVRTNDLWYGMSEEEVDDRKEFIRCYLNKDFELLFLIPIPPRENDFWFSSHQDFIESAFNTYDYQKDKKPFDKYGYRIRKIMEEVKDLAILKSSISRPEGRANIQRRYDNLVENEFRDRLVRLVEKYRKLLDEEIRSQIRQKIGELNRRILQCQRIWEKYSRWE